MRQALLEAGQGRGELNMRAGVLNDGKLYGALDATFGARAVVVDPRDFAEAAGARSAVSGYSRSTAADPCSVTGHGQRRDLSSGRRGSAVEFLIEGAEAIAARGASRKLPNPSTAAAAACPEHLPSLPMWQAPLPSWAFAARGTLTAPCPRRWRWWRGGRATRRARRAWRPSE